MTVPYDNDLPPHRDEDAPPADEYEPHRVDPDTGEISDDESDDPILQVLAGFQQTLDGQQEQITEILEMMKAAPDGPWNWATLTGPERRKLWQRLYDWVTWLEDRYLRHLSPARNGIPEWPADWYRHPVAVEMLTALMVAHISAYRKKASPPSFTLVEWHERCLWPTLARIESLNLWNRNDTTNDWDGPAQRDTRRDDTRFDTWMSADVDAHLHTVER